MSKSVWASRALAYARCRRRFLTDLELLVERELFDQRFAQVVIIIHEKECAFGHGAFRHLLRLVLQIKRGTVATSSSYRSIVPCFEPFASPPAPETGDRDTFTPGDEPLRVRSVAVGW